MTFSDVGEIMFYSKPLCLSDYHNFREVVNPLLKNRILHEARYKNFYVVVYLDCQNPGLKILCFSQKLRAHGFQIALFFPLMKISTFYDKEYLEALNSGLLKGLDGKKVQKMQVKLNLCKSETQNVAVHNEKTNCIENIGYKAHKEKLERLHTSLLDCFNSRHKKKSKCFEISQTRLFFRCATSHFKNSKVDIFDITEIYSKFSNNMLTDIDGCVRVFDDVTESRQIIYKNDLLIKTPRIFIIESKSRVDKIKIDQKLEQIFLFKKSLTDSNVSMKGNSRKFMQLMKRYDLKKNFDGYDFHIIFSFQYIDADCLEYLESINSGTIETDYYELVFKIFRQNNNYRYLCRSYKELQNSPNFKNFKSRYDSLQEQQRSDGLRNGEKVCGQTKYPSLLRLGVVDRYLCEYSRLHPYFNEFRGKIGYMDSANVFLDGKKIS